MNPHHSPQAAAGPQSDLSTDRLASLVQQKNSLVHELYRLVSQQQQLIDSQEVDLLPLLAVKQRVLEALNQVDRDMDPFRGQEPEERIWPSLASRQACKEEADQCEHLFRQVLMMENQCAKVLQQQQDKTRQQLHGSLSANQAARAYQGPASDPVRQSQLDLSSED